jgi:hypothetical protein
MLECGQPICKLVRMQTWSKYWGGSGVVKAIAATTTWEAAWPASLKSELKQANISDRTEQNKNDAF